MEDFLSCNQGTDFFAQDNAPDVSGLVHVEDDHGQVVVFAEAHGGEVHDL